MGSAAKTAVTHEVFRQFSLIGIFIGFDDRART